MDMFCDLESIDDSKKHHKYKIIKKHFPVYQKIINDWAKDFEDRDNKIVIEFQTTYHSTLWELYLFKVLKSCGFKLDLTYNHPDFIVTGNTPFYMEAVVANIKADGTKEEERKIEDSIRSLDPPVLITDFDDMMRESITRCSNSIKSKSEKYKNTYKNSSHINEETPYVVALASYDFIHYGREYIHPILALLYGKYYNRFDDCYDDIYSIHKPGSNAEISVNIFDDEEYNHVSAVIFTSSLTMGKLSSLAITKGEFCTNEVNLVRHDRKDPILPYKIHTVENGFGEELTDGLFVFHNPNAKNKLDTSIFKKERITQYTIKGRQLYVYTRYPVLVRRLDLPKLISKTGANELMLTGIMMGFNKRNDLVFDWEFEGPYNDLKV